jgi:hypothetical protein
MPPPLCVPRTTIVALGREERGGRGSSQGHSASRAAHTASQALPLMGRSPNRIYRPATQPALFDLRHERRGEPSRHHPCSPLGLCQGANSSGGAAGEEEEVVEGGRGSLLPCHLSNDTGAGLLSSNMTRLMCALISTGIMAS